MIWFLRQFVKFDQNCKIWQTQLIFIVSLTSVTWGFLSTVWRVNYTFRSQQASGSSAGTSIYAEQQGVQVQVRHPYPLLPLDLPRGIWGLPGTWQKPVLLTFASWHWSHNQMLREEIFPHCHLKSYYLEKPPCAPLMREFWRGSADHHSPDCSIFLGKTTILSFLCFIGWAPWNTGLASKGNAHQIHSCWSNFAEPSGVIYAQHDMLGLWFLLFLLMVILDHSLLLPEVVLWERVTLNPGINQKNTIQKRAWNLSISHLWGQSLVR